MDQPINDITQEGTFVSRRCVRCSNGHKDCTVCNGTNRTNHFIFKGYRVCPNLCFNGITLIEKETCTTCNGEGMIPVDMGEFGMFSTDDDITFETL